MNVWLFLFISVKDQLNFVFDFRYKVCCKY